MTALRETTWIEVCTEDAVPPESGAAVLLPDGRQVAVFRTHDGELYALDNVDPFCGAAVLARGIIGDRGSVPVIVSPMYKHAFELRTGRCLDDPDVFLDSWRVRIRAGAIAVRFP